MKSKLLGSVVLASAIATGASADVQLFGHLGAMYNQGINNGNNGYAGLTGHIAVDAGNSDFGVGVGAWAGTRLFSTGSSNYGNRYGSDYIDLSDLYFRYTGGFNLFVGRFDANFLEADWIDNYIQGVAVSFDARDFGVWLTWANDYTTYGVQPGRIGSELASYSRFPSSFNSFGVGNNDMIAAGLKFDIGVLQIDPFVHYWLRANNNYDVIQAGAKFALILGDDSGVKSITSLRFMWQHNNSNSHLVWVDEELRFNNVVKIGAGYYAVGREGITTMTDHSRFYGRYINNNININGNSYFTSNADAWYVFGGIEHDKIKLDILYADGSYKEFSAVGSVRVYDDNVSVMREGLGIDVGAGYVNSGFSENTINHNIIVFAKLVF